MCDNHATDRDAAAQLDAILAKRGITRRQFSAVGAAIAIAACAPHERATANEGLAESMVSIATPDGEADAFFVHPATGKHPAVIMWPDVAGLRDAYKVMARRLATAGYAVLVPNAYYRDSKAPVLTSLSQWFEPEHQARIKPMLAKIDGKMIAQDARTYADWLDGQDSVDIERRIGTSGYCMGGAYAVRTAAAASTRIGAVCSFHGSRLVTQDADSPHTLIAATQARYLFAIGKDDDAKAPEEKTILKQVTDDAGRPAEIEVYPADHGWCTIDAPSYDKAAAEKAWARMLATYATAL
ncbi:putative hydrolase [Caenibius tardaugens NBRC 16725]|uniref:Putative hydrolase n=1 Tax=Caenibius tardaugens NBRC 16725 TaxID=1219035 RepID=U3A7K7_9SPHN|nr:dienelactone hydrolase family protein [Caenibius tardaugens]AZI36447.1 dienelactone hydrolase family protein [Caenibius tardaugens NBRC 16725]GAD50738.1 putative hydrolase [Caenibius tardaugens NBRC 16725]